MANRDLYLALGRLCTQHAATSRSLEHYLLALLGLARSHAGQDGLAPEAFYQLLAAAFDAVPLPFEPDWCDGYDAFDSSAPGYPGWHATLVRQIVDLHEMARDGLLDHEYRYFGLNAPRGGCWYNFHPTAYLECGMAGALGGWQAGDDSGPQWVPGQVATVDASGTLQVVDLQDIGNPILPITHLSWKLLQDFLDCGQQYE